MHLKSNTHALVSKDRDSSDSASGVAVRFRNQSPSSNRRSRERERTNSSSNLGSGGGGVDASTNKHRAERKERGGIETDTSISSTTMLITSEMPTDVSDTLEHSWIGSHHSGVFILYFYNCNILYYVFSILFPR